MQTVILACPTCCKYWVPLVRSACSHALKTDSVFIQPGHHGLVVELSEVHAHLAVGDQAVFNPHVQGNWADQQAR